MAGSASPRRANRAAFPKQNAARIASAMQFLRGLRDHASLIARAGEFVFGGLAAAVAGRDRGCTIGRTAGDLVEFQLAGKAVIEADDGHAEMQEVGDDREQRGFLAAVLARGRGESAADLAVQGALGPEAAGLIEEVRHLRRHAAEAGAGADDDGVIIGKLFDLRHRRGLIELVIRRLRDFRRHQLGHAPDVDGGAGLARAFGDRVRHRLDVTIGGIIQDEYFSHGWSPWGWDRKLSSSCPALAVRRTASLPLAYVPGIHVLAFGQDVDGRDEPGHDDREILVSDERYAASTSTSSESSSAVILSFASSRIAAPSRALTRTPLISTAPAAGTR